MKKTIIVVFLAAALTISAHAARLLKVRAGYYADKIRTVLELDSEFKYHLEESKEKIVIRVPDAKATADIPNFVEINDFIVRYFEIEKEPEGLKISIPLSEPIPYNMFTMENPPRLVIDFSRDFTNIISGGTIIDGVEALEVSKGTQNGRVVAHVLKIDPLKVEIAPALARKRRPNLLETFNPWREPEDYQHFSRAKVSSIAEEQDAVAAVNGAYFAYTGKPLGTLLIDKELISSPVYDRTALLITDDNHASVDNIIIDSYFKTPDGARYDITGINQERNKNSTVMYSPTWGGKTDTSFDGVELVISNSTIKEMQMGNSTIPKDGYVLSINGPAAQFLKENIKIGDRIETHIKIVPYSTSPKNIKHLISGGPRLVKEGIVYVSKHEEKFKADIAQGRAARTAVGVTKDNKVLLATVDGLPRGKVFYSEKSSIGMTLEELAKLMISLGADEAMNLDGGSSSTMWIDGRVVNNPTSGYEIRVSNAIVIRGR